MADPDAILNARGWKCPLPVIRAARLIALAAAGETLLVEATDPRAPVDFEEWIAADHDAEILDQHEADDPDGRKIFRILLRRLSGPT